MRARLLPWPAAIGLLVLSARALAYALAPSPLAGRLEGSTGGPRLVVVTLVALGVAAVVSTLAVWLVAVGVRERQRLRPERAAPRLRLRRLGLRAVVLFAGSSLAFALFESYLHWRAGIGFHGLSCLAGPVHRNVIPLLAALSLIAAALAEAVGHVAGWMRAVVRELRRRRLLPLRRSQRPVLLRGLTPRAAVLRGRGRAPPAPA
jgi:hypothetical protein